MTAPSYTTFKGISNYSDVQLMSELENNLKYWLDWSLLSIGGWSDVTISGFTGVYPGNPSKLNFVHDNSYTDGQVWQTSRKDLVWESGVGYLNSEPINITGVSISGSMKPLNGSPSGYINYPLGRVVFSTPIATGSPVKLDYSYRTVQVYKADDAPWWRAIQFDTLNNPQFTQDKITGEWSIGAHHRIQLPAIILETVPRAQSRGYELGNGSLVVEQDIIFHILADNRQDRNNLTSILFLQNDKTIYLFNSNQVASGKLFPLDYRGSKINHINYPDLVSETGCRYKICRLNNTVISEVESMYPNLYESTVRTTAEVVFGNI